MPRRAGTLRAHGPQSGKELWRVAAHHKPVTAVATCADGRLLTGGEDGLVRVWQQVGPRFFSLLGLNLI